MKNITFEKFEWVYPEGIERNITATIESIRVDNKKKLNKTLKYEKDSSTVLDMLSSSSSPSSSSSSPLLSSSSSSPLLSSYPTTYSSINSSKKIPKQLKKKKSSNVFKIDIPVISEKTYFEIVRLLASQSNVARKLKHSAPTSGAKWKYLPINQNNNAIRKSTLKALCLFVNNICPWCRAVNCIYCGDKKKKLKKKRQLLSARLQDPRGQDTRGHDPRGQDPRWQDPRWQKPEPGVGKIPYITSLKTKEGYPKFVKCFCCHRLYRTVFETVSCENYQFFRHKFKSIRGSVWQCQKCFSAHASLYWEFLRYLKMLEAHETLLLPDSSHCESSHCECSKACQGGCQKRNTDTNGTDNNNNSYYSAKSRTKQLFRSLSAEARRELGNNFRALYYTLKVRSKNTKRKKRGDSDTQTKGDSHAGYKIIPPFAFMADTNKQASFYEKLLTRNNSMRLDVKTKYGSVNSRARGGKHSFFRNNALKKRYLSAARVVIVPRKELMPHECVLPESLYLLLNCPKVIVGHRYPTLDVRSVTYHKVIGTWNYKTLGISTAIVSGNNADFDGDCLHIIPVMSLQSRAELEFLCHPRYNMIVQNRLRVCFDHDEVQTIFSQFGITGEEIHRALYQLAVNKGNVEAYQTFCNLRTFCHNVWEYQSIPTVSFGDYREIYTKLLNARLPNADLFKTRISDIGKAIQKVDYTSFIRDVFPAVSEENGIKQMILSQSSRFSVDHLWQLFREINRDAKMSFLSGMDRAAFIAMAKLSRHAIIKDVADYGYSYIKLTHCTKSIAVGYDERLYSTDGILIANNVSEFYGDRKKKQ